jgi:hypothetical protein
MGENCELEELGVIDLCSKQTRCIVFRNIDGRHKNVKGLTILQNCTGGDKAGFQVHTEFFILWVECKVCRLTKTEGEVYPNGTREESMTQAPGSSIELLVQFHNGMKKFKYTRIAKRTGDAYMRYTREMKGQSVSQSITPLH